MAVHNVSRCNTLPPMQNTMLLVVMGIGWTAPSLAGEPALEAEPLRTPRPVGKNLWRASLAAVTAVNVMNAGSSWGKRELNPNLSGNNGRFGAQGGGLKLGIVGRVECWWWNRWFCAASRLLRSSTAGWRWSTSAPIPSRELRRFGISGFRARESQQGEYNDRPRAQGRA